jgi:polar amino acid transport system substrate-binding protein
MVSGILTILMLLPSLVGSALAAPTPTIDAIRQAGKFKVAIDVTYPPMETTDAKGNPDGFDVDLAKEFARRLGVQVEFVVMSWDGIIAGLMSKRYDMICSAMNITPERLRQLDIIEYMQVSQVFVSPVDKPVVKEADLAGKTVAVQVDTTSATYVEKAKKNGLAIAGIKGFKVGQYFVKQDPKRVVVSGRAIAPEPIGVALRKDTKDLSAEVTRMIADMRRDGTMKKLHIKWFGVELGS